MHSLSDRTMASEDHKSCKNCNWSVSSSDPHPTCLSHNTTCFVYYEYDHTVCEFCTPMINGASAGDKAQKALLNDRITAMRKAISKAIKANKVPEEVSERFLRTNDVFKPSVAHLNPALLETAQNHLSSLTPPPLQISLVFKHQPPLPPS